MSVRSVLDLAVEALHELLAAADFLIRRVDQRFVLPREDDLRGPR